jgi:hypothetical protein
LLPFDDPNYGLDESWAALHPYWVTLRPGETAQVALRITNHSPRAHTFRAAVRAREGFSVASLKPARIAAHSDGILRMTVRVPGNCRPGLHVVVADIGWESAELREWTECVLEVVP